jgi:CheY-like chemotaxis protein
LGEIRSRKGKYLYFYNTKTITMKLSRKLNSILLVDDDPDDNFFHEIVLKEMDIVNHINIVSNGLEALNYLKKEIQVPPELIFLDINMPRMNGWEFLDQYKHLKKEQKARVVIMILTTSANPDDIKRAKEIEEVTGYETKPLTKEMMTEILQEHFQDYI